MPEVLQDKQYHAQLLADIDNIAATANVQVKYIKTSMYDMPVPVPEQVIDFVRKYRKFRGDNETGLLLEGLPHADVICQAMVGAFIRNYIDARIIPIHALIDHHERHEIKPLMCSVLLIPNLYVQALEKGIPRWKMNRVYEILMQRATAGKPTVVWVEDRLQFAKAYGIYFNSFFDQYRIVQGKQEHVA
jgi:hypothetical protein